MRIEELDTPAVIVDLDVLEVNIRSLADYCRAHGIGLRPHTKTHKIPAIAKTQMESGALGITVAKVGEAEVMAAAGLDNILVAYPVLGESKLQRLTRLALEKKITVALDSREALEGISAAANKAKCQIQILIEFDMGMQRCGLQSVSDLVRMAYSIENLPGVRFAGIMFYPGHIWNLPPDQSSALNQLSNRILEIREQLGKAGLGCEIVSGGSTPTAYNSHLVQGLKIGRAHV